MAGAEGDRGTLGETLGETFSASAVASVAVKCSAGPAPTKLWKARVATRRRKPRSASASAAIT